MKRSAWGLSLALALAVSSASASTGPEVRTADVDLFYRLYDAAGGAPTGPALQSGYIDAGSDGVRQFVPNRILSGEALAKRIARDHAAYEGARACVSVLPGTKARLARAFARLGRLYPQASYPPVTILIGGNNSGGTTGESGVLIGLEVVCRADWMQPNLEDRYVHLIAHEYGHIQQMAAPSRRNADEADHTLLEQSLIEGVAELLGELTSGDVSNSHLKTWARGREREFETAFVARMDGKDFSGWLYEGPGTREKPGDLGYWVGWRIAKSYYLHARDKKAALRDLIELRDPKAILAGSGWTPGMKL